jgi:choice-of-anchor A domain-containing protein
MKTSPQHITSRTSRIDSLGNPFIRKQCYRSLLVGALLGAAMHTVRADINLGAAAPYTVLYAGSGHLGFSASSENGNMGLAKGASLSLNPTSSVDGNVDFAGSINLSGGNLVTGSIQGGVGGVTSAIHDINSLSANKAVLEGSELSIRLPDDQIIDASNGKGTGNDYVFEVTDFKFDGGKTLTINGDNLGGNVIFNFEDLKMANFNGSIVLTGGLCADNVLWNFSGEGTKLGNKGNANLKGIFLDPNGEISFGGNAELCGRLFGGTGGDMKVIGESKIGICQCPEPTTHALLGLGLIAALLFHCHRCGKSQGSDGTIEDHDDVSMVPSPASLKRGKRVIKCRWM